MSEAKKMEQKISNRKISEIKIEGNKRITDETIKLFSGVDQFKNKYLTNND